MSESRYKAAKRKMLVRARISDIADSIMTAGAKHLHMCGEGPHNGWSVLFAQIFYTECPCCNFYRGVTVGVMLSLAIAAPAMVALMMFC